MDRRKFISSIIRGSIFLGLVAVAGRLIFREKKDGADNYNCDFVCRKCNSLNNCQLPEASNFRNKENYKAGESKQDGNS